MPTMTITDEEIRAARDAGAEIEAIATRLPDESLVRESLGRIVGEFRSLVETVEATQD